MRERTGSRLTAFELMPRFGIDLLLKHGMIARDPAASLSPWYALVEVNRMKGGVPGALEAALAEAFERGLVADATIAQSESDRDADVDGARVDERRAIAAKAHRSSTMCRCRSPRCRG